MKGTILTQLKSSTSFTISEEDWDINVLGYTGVDKSWNPMQVGPKEKFKYRRLMNVPKPLFEIKLSNDQRRSIIRFWTQP
jgi:hypothetical protein